jgi:hypothetical protein
LQTRAVRATARALALAALLLSGTLVHAGYVAIDEPALDAIFGQPLAKWGWSPIDVRVAPSASYADSALTSIDDDGELWRLFSLAPRRSRTIEVFFVDSINSCGGYAPNVIGCGLQPGNALVVSSQWAASRWGPALLAHELGHNLGLEHVPQSTPNLMNPWLTGNTDLDAGQVRSLYQSPLVDWSDGPARPFFSILPIAVVASDWSGGWIGNAPGSVGRANVISEPRPLALLVAAVLLLAVTRARPAASSRTLPSTSSR